MGVFPDLAVIAIGAVGFCSMLAAFVMIARRGGWQQAMQADARGRWPIPRHLMLAGALLGVLFGAVLLLGVLVAYLRQPPALREVRRFEGHPSVVSRVAISADGQRLLSTSSGYQEDGQADDSVRVWDASTGQELRRLDGHDQVHSLAISADGHRALTGGQNSLRLWDLDNGQIVQHLKANQPNAPSQHDMWVVAFSPDGKQALSGGWDGTVRLWDLAAGKESRRLPANAEYVMSVAFSPDGGRIAAGSGSGWTENHPDKEKEDNFVQIWDGTTGQELHRLKTDRDTATCLAFSPDGDRLLAASRYGHITRLWDLNSGQEIHRFKGEWTVHAVTFSPDGRQALCLDGFYTVGLWDVARGKEIGRAATRQDGAQWQRGVECAAFAANARYAVAGDRNKVMWLWVLPE